MATMAVFRPIDSDDEHHLILAELGVLDDLENWELFKKQEARFHRLDSLIDVDQWRQYVVPLRSSRAR